MPRREPIVPGEFYHLYNRGCARTRIFFGPANYRFFLKSWREHLPPHAVQVIAYCLMSNHYHFVVRPETNDFSSRMQAFGTSYSKAINRQLNRVGPVFQSRFEAKHVHKVEYLLHLTRYVHLNPVAAGMFSDPAEWEYSSYRDYIGLRDGTLPCLDVVLREFDGHEAYREFVESGLPDAPGLIAHLLFDEDD